MMTIYMHPVYFYTNLNKLYDVFDNITKDKLLEISKDVFVYANITDKDALRYIDINIAKYILNNTGIYQYYFLNCDLTRYNDTQLYVLGLINSCISLLDTYNIECVFNTYDDNTLEYVLIKYNRENITYDNIAKVSFIKYNEDRYEFNISIIDNELYARNIYTDIIDTSLLLKVENDAIADELDSNLLIQYMIASLKSCMDKYLNINNIYNDYHIKYNKLSKYEKDNIMKVINYANNKCNI